MSDPKIEIRDENFFPQFSNIISITKNSIDKFMITFGFKDLAQVPNNPKAKSISRISMSRKGTETLSRILTIALKQDPPQGNPPSRF